MDDIREASSQDDTPVDPSLESLVAELDTALAAGRANHVTRILRDEGHRLLAPQVNQTMSLAFDLLAEAPASDDPILAALESLLRRVQLRVDDAAEASARAERLWREASQRGADDGRPDERVAAVMLWRARCGWSSPRQAVAIARECLDCQHGDVEGQRHRLGVGARLVWSAMLLDELATTEMLLGDLEEARIHVADAEYLTRMIRHERLLAVALGARAFLETIGGRYESAAGTARESLTRRPLNGDLPLPYLARVQWVLGWAAAQRLDTAVGRDHLEAAEEQAGAHLDATNSELLLLLRARLLGQEGDVARARQLLDQQAQPPAVAPHLARLRAVTEAHTACLGANSRAVVDAVDRLRELGQEEDALLFESIVASMAGDWTGALELARSLVARPHLHPAVLVGGASLEMGLLLVLERRAEAGKLLPGLLVLAEPQRLVEPLSAGLLAGSRFLDLVGDHVARTEGGGFAAEVHGRLSRSFVAGAGLGVETASHHAPASTSLTARELVVLRELANGGSYRDVAQALFISENTVKSHIAAVYRKLGVDRRGEALRLARVSGLV